MKWMTAAIAATALATGAGASAQNSDIIYAFTKADFIEAVNGAEGTAQANENGRNLSLTLRGRLKADGLLMACDDNATETNCLGTSILATFSPRATSTAEEITAAINEYNYNENFGRAYRDPEGTVSVRLYIIADGGITRENYRRQIELWTNSLEDFFGYLYPELDS